MKQTIGLSQFRDAFSIRPNNFSYDALGLLFNYLEQMEKDCGEELELDAIAICCDYAESTFAEVADNYSIDLTDCDGEEKKLEAVVCFLEDQSTVVGVVAGTDRLIYAQF